MDSFQKPQGTAMGFTIYDLRFTIYDFFDPKKGRFVPFSDQKNRKS